MAFFTINDTLHQKHLFSTTLCKYSSTFHYSPTHTQTPHKKSTLFVDKAKNINSKLHEPSANVETLRENGSGVSSFRPRNERGGAKLKENGEIGLVEEERFTNDVYSKKMVDSRNREKMGSGFTSMRSKHANLELNPVLKRNNNSLVNRKINKNMRKIDRDSKVGDDKKQKGSRRRVVDPKEVNWKETLNMCSKRGDVMGAIDWYDEARKNGIEMGQYYYTVLLYLCSSAATGVVHPAKSGSGSRNSSLNASNEVSTLSSVDYRDMGKGDFNSIESNREDKNVADLRNGNDVQENNEILVSEEIKKYALERGFEIYERMCLEKVPMNEATLTSVGRMAMSMGDGDMAFDMVKQMKILGINPRLRSYGPALSAYCNSGDSYKAFVVEKHMLEHGVEPEEPELEALLRASIEDCKSDKIYYVLHKLRSSVRKVSPSVANLIEKWFMSKEASKVGKRKPDKKIVKEAIDRRGGGWHGEGWLGQGKWIVSHTTIADDGVCKCCGEKLTTIDLDPVETENFAKSVASIATRREKNSSFQNFQKWLDYYGPFEAVVDAANVGLFSQKRFIPSKISAVVNGIRQTLPSKKWPLIILHNRRVTGQKMDEPVNKALVEKWKIADALYPTPTGSNDDWYWLYAAIKFKCLLVTNDEMRDHTFQLLGNDFFPKWKERHQVHFDFSDAGPIFHMPPPCSVVIQESDSGHWHIPVASEHDSEEERTWLCVTRSNSIMKKQGSITKSKGSYTRYKVQTHEEQEVSENPQQKDNFTNLRNILSESVFSNNTTTTIRTEIEAGEVLGNCTIDFQI